MACMDRPTFGVQAAMASVELPEEWQALLAHQAAVLVALLSRMQKAAATLRRRQAPAARWQVIAAEAERVLTAQAQGHVSLERELVELRALVMDLSTRPAAMVERVQRLERVLEVFHANLTIARQYLATLFPQEP